MRKPIIAGNWKMNKTPAETAALIAELKPLVKEAGCDVVICPPAICLPEAAKAIKGSKIRLGAQNAHFMDSGAYTGEISCGMLKSVSVTYVIIGHSERRQYFAETDKTVNQRALAAVRCGLIPIICVGETLPEREAGYTDALVACQTLIALAGLTGEQVAQTVVAYEPVWAIGTGVTATDQQANETIGVIRKTVTAKYGAKAGRAVRILYGGSMNPANVKGLMAQTEIDGGLIGGASLKAGDFAKVVMHDR